MGVFRLSLKKPSKIREYPETNEEIESGISTKAEVVIPLLGEETSRKCWWKWQQLSKAQIRFRPLI
ncbi:MAG: hypothetical protein CM15mP121_1230 [Bacteroidota bacterium]|nr:MAG: hypothetical protein CM15mP121_1230 [Bacteroidota bacterium]